MGLKPARDRLCVVQLSPGDGTVDVVRIAQGQTSAPNLARLLTDPAVLKIFHFARFDVALLRQALGIEVAPIWCTKIASRLVRTYTDRHGLKDLTREVLGHRDLQAAADPPTGARRSFRKRRSNMPPPTSCTFTPSRRRWRRGSAARAGWRWRSPASASCRCAPNSTCSAGTDEDIFAHS